jgi:hypothetical protein
MSAQISDTDPSVIAGLAWFHFAVIAVPMMIFILRLEWQDWKEEHPRFSQSLPRFPGFHLFHPRPA